MNMSLDQSLIKDLPPFLDMDHEALAELLGVARSEHFAKGDAIFSQADEAHKFYVLLDGYIQVAKLTPDGEQVVMRYITSGELFGIAKAVGQKNYPASAIAAVDCVVLVISDAIWDELTDKYPTFASNTYKTVGERLIETQQHVVELATEKVEQRIANAVLKLANQTGRKTEEGILIDFPISRKDISEMTGTTLHTVSRLLSAWEDKGLIKSGRQKITLVEGHKLMLVANGITN
ncbi:MULTISPECIES: Crp/Fnr family transcriptional regulator [unclassified Lentilitoribacter]|uniref:Crp/Fnr family transcriptional regulator n=1 Tax=unclassified Lentilitoribacter TaxID=2647570 RepID=UPI0031B68F8E